VAFLLGLGVGHAVDAPVPDETACLPVAGGGALTVEGVGRVVFTELATDRVRDAATFDGRVCLAVAGSDVLFRTERLEVTDLGGALTLGADDVRVEVPGWTLEAAELRGGSGWAELVEVTIVGADAVGVAATMRIDFSSGVIVAVGLRLMTPSLRVDAAFATLDGEVLVAERARLSTCDCPSEDAPLRIDADRVRLDVSAETSALVEGGTVVAGGVRWPLGDTLTLDAESLADLALPIAIGPDPSRDGAWRVALLAQEVAPGVRASASWSTRVGALPARGGFGLEADATGVALAWTGASDRWSLDLRGGTALGDGWRVDARQRFEAGAIQEPVRDTSLRATYGASSTGHVGRASVEAGALAALTGQTLADREVAGPRLGVDARAAWSAPSGPFVPGLEIAAAATAYPTSGAQQVWASVRPTLAVRAGALRVDAAHLARWVHGGSPFSARVDRAIPEQRSDLAAAWSDALPGGLRLDVSGALRYTWDPDPLRAGRRLGVEDLTVRARATLPSGEASWSLALELRLAGRIDPRPGRDAFASLRLAWVRERWEAGVRTTVGLEPGGGWRDLTVFAAVPIDASEAWSWRPYLAVDLLAVAGGTGSWLRGHGLDLAWRTCCGTVELGYRSDAVDGATTHFAVLLPVRPLDPAHLTSAPGAR
jgi:hypothetical protein